MTLARRVSHGKSGGRISARDSGARFAKTTARTEMRGTISAMTRPFPRLPLGRRWPGRHLRRQAATLFRNCSVEWPRPNPERAFVRSDQQRGQSRRGCEGILLLPRQHSDALLHEVPVQVSAAGIPLSRPGGNESDAGRAKSSSMNYSILGYLMPTDISMCSSNTPRQIQKTC